ncbi:uncharacterized protein NECHADRAFT_89251 [Fusarium vanettenii 77-13-4]|uniref:Uncharacterized protein n=1 Tax=Fusarium vanettenii (strain ATCC MYA-4622 / CBS 123669 / FGSC 9596 / NRRL 45880 / 77-13-4) TaxID=660122 RepID=C7ZQM5_FUSV7|nr:uncharacterized protein NECHADRAFT_89251 [Fusarium vanettenii 77-13-4]EEU33685.1 hypothetical protein NECHADRAFT_89251 [Fusarium vanettenii 77-13-4]
MPSSIAISAGPSATPYHRSPKRTSSSANSSSLSSPSSAPPSAGKDKALHTRRPTLVTRASPRIQIFLPSYVDCDYVLLENRRDPIHAILISDEESKNLLPQ